MKPHVFLLLCLALTMLSVPDGAAQVTLVRREFTDVSVPYNAPNGSVTPFVVDESGKITQFWWWFSSTGWRDLHIRYSLPDGTYFEQVAGQPWVSIDQVFDKESSGTWTLKLLETVPGTTHTLTTGIQLVTQRTARQDLPVTGWPIDELSGLDSIVLDFLTNYGFEAATLAVCRNNRLVFERGYGWQDEALTTPISPKAIMRIASNTIPITRGAVRYLIETGRLTGSTKVFDYLGIAPPAGWSIQDERVRDITVDHLLNDSSGFPDQMPGPRDVGIALGLGRNADLSESIAYMWTRPLLFTPGTSSQFTHWGYQLLGAVIEQASGLSYDDFVHYELGLAGDMPTLQVAASSYSEASHNEIWYAGETFEHLESDFPQTQEMVPAPYAIDMSSRPGAGSIACSARDFCRFLTQRFHTGSLKPPSLGGWTWEYTFYGSLPGTLTVTYDRVTPNGASYNFVLLVNERINSRSDLHDEIKSQIQQYLSTVVWWPEYDLFLEPEEASNARLNISSLTGSSLSIEALSDTTDTFRYQKSTDLETWHTDLRLLLDAGNSQTISEDVTSQDQAFFRLTR